MSLPVSQYEALLEEVRSLGRKAHRVQQIAEPLLTIRNNSSISSYFSGCSGISTRDNLIKVDDTMDSEVFQRIRNRSSDHDRNSKTETTRTSKNEDEDYVDGAKSATQLSVSSEPLPNRNKRGGSSASSASALSVLYHGTWPVERNLWNSEPSNLAPAAPNSHYNGSEMESVVSFASSSGGAPLDRVLSSPDRSRRSSQQLEAKVDMVYSLLAMLGGQEHADMGETLLALSASPESCTAMRQSGCIPLLVQLVQSDKNSTTRKKASQALHNLVYSNPDEKQKKRESRVLKLLEQTRAYVSYLKNQTDFDPDDLTLGDDGDKHPVQTLAHLMKLSFDEGHRQAICHLGGIHTIASLIEVEHSEHGNNLENSQCVLLRRYGCMALTNLTFGDSGNKALLCSLKSFMYALVSQLQNTNDDLCQVTASVLRNLSWRADSTSKEVLKEIGAVRELMKAAMSSSKENTLKSILSALWNLSAHCSENKAEICAVDGALGFLVDMLSYESPTKSLAVVENAGGILRNISSQIAVRDDYREILRRHDCLKVLLDLLKSPSLTIVSNSCGSLWNLSAKNAQDQEALWEMGAPNMLRSLNHSKHKMIAMGSSAALKNLLASRPSHNLTTDLDTTAKNLDLPTLPSLGARKQKALMEELDQNLTETFENIEKDSPVKNVPQERDLTNVQIFEKFKKSNKWSGSQEYVSLNDAIVTNDRGSSRNCKSNDDLSTAFRSLNIDQQIFSKIGANSEFKKTKLVQETYGIYAETDLDQPTDYSLRYGEDDSDSDDLHSKKVHDFVLDTLKTYCTEDTPYETPFNFSTATSMSDLRDVGKQQQQQRTTVNNDNDIDKIEINKIEEKQQREKKTNVDDDKDRCSIDDVSEVEVQKEATVKRPTHKSEFSSGMMSPEKPIRYAEEGTPGCFSRVSSFGSFEGEKEDEQVEKCEKYDQDKFEEKKNRVEPTIATNVDAKVVKIDRGVNYAEETPLMFSRSSSLASLDSIEQHSIHEDRESVVSDFSRLTSGIVSPSELPDSPTQTIAPSPRRRKSSQDSHPSTSKTCYKQTRTTRNQNKHCSRDVFDDDNVTKFKEESTPVQFSTATSLSSLTFDETDAGTTASKNNAKLGVDSPPIDKCKEKGEKQDLEREKEDESFKGSDNLQTVSESEEDEDNILAACISDGMNNNRHRQSNEGVNISCSRIPTSLLGYKSRFPCSTTVVKPFVNSDTLHSYCTEDTPAVLSHTGSQSNLSVLSTVDETKKEESHNLSDDSSSVLSAENDKLLAECIQAAMPKPKPRTPTVNSPQTSGKNKLVNKQFQTNCYLGAKDEISGYAVENSPNLFSLRSSLSDLTVDGSVCGVAKKLATNVGDGADSLSSLSSTEQEEELLEQCISSGMPKKDDESSKSGSKNECVTSAAGITRSEIQKKRSEKLNNTFTLPDHRTTAAGGENTTTEEQQLQQQQRRQQTRETNKLSEEKNSTIPTNIGFDEKTQSVNEIDNRMLDPDAMIESLDRFTAELVSQAEVHLSKDKSMIVSANVENTDTWNDEDDYNTFPSISDSGPKIPSFKETNCQTNEYLSLESNTATESTLKASENTVISCLESSINNRLLELDSIEPPSLVNSLDLTSKQSPKINKRRMILQPGLMARRALTNNRQIHSSIDSSVSNLDSINPPSVFNDLLDMESSANSLSSLTSEIADFKVDFVTSNPIDTWHTAKTNLDVEQPLSIIHVEDFELTNSLPQKRDAVDDLNNSLADVETIFEDANTNTLDDDLTLYSDALTATPMPSDGCESAETTPKKNKKLLQKRLTPKQKRNMAKERYRTYTVAAGMVVNDEHRRTTDKDETAIKTTPKDRRKNDRSRFETQVIEESVTNALKEMNKSPKAFAYAQKRQENKDRFKTRTISESSVSSEVSNTSPNLDDLHSLIRREANKVANSLKDSANDDALLLLECETLSLVSNDDDSEYNSLINYRTYTKYSSPSSSNVVKEENVVENVPTQTIATIIKPKITKPTEERNDEEEEQKEVAKTVRGRRKPLYSSPYKPVKEITSNLVRNVTSALKYNGNNNSEKPPLPKLQQRKVATSAKTFNYQKRGNCSSSTSASSSNMNSPVRSSICATNNNKSFSPKKTTKIANKQGAKSAPPPLERQGTFTKDEPQESGNSKGSSRIPTPTTKTLLSKIARPVLQSQSKVIPVKSSSADRSRRVANSNGIIYGRSPSADSGKTTRSNTNDSQRSASNSSISSNGSIPKKQSVSKIASLWKRVEEQKKNKQQKQPDTRVWIQTKK